MDLISLKIFLIPPGRNHFSLIPCFLMHLCHLRNSSRLIISPSTRNYLVIRMNFLKDIESGWKSSGRSSLSLMILSIISIQIGSNCPGIKKNLPERLKFKIVLSYSRCFSKFNANC